MRVVVCLEIERIKAHILIWTARPERAPEWSVVKPDETCSWPTGRTPPSRDRCHRTRTETSLLSCNTQTLHECVINSWALYQHLTLKHKSYISPNVFVLLFGMNLILQDMHVINYIYKITSSVIGSYVSSPVSWPLVPTDELRLMTKRRTSFLNRTLQAGPSSDIAFPPEHTYTSIHITTIYGLNIEMYSNGWPLKTNIFLYF